MAPKLSKPVSPAGKSASARRHQKISLKKHAKDAIRKITDHLKENPNKIFPALAHILDMDGDMTLKTATQPSLQDLFDDEPWPNTYHIWKKVPEYFLVAWLRTKLTWWTAEVYAMSKHHDPKVVRKIVEALTGLGEKTKVPLECLNKVVCARFLDFLYAALGSRGQVIQDAMDDEAKFDWAGKGVWRVERTVSKLDDPDDGVPDGTWLALTSCSPLIQKVQLAKRLQMDPAVEMVNNWSDMEAQTSEKVGGFSAIDVASDAQDLKAFTDIFDTTYLKEQAKQLMANLQRELFHAKTGAVRADEEMLAASSVKRRKTLAEEVQSGKRQIVKTKAAPAPPPGPAAPTMSV